MLNQSLKDKAINLRKEGYSYSYINKKTNIPKGTLNYLLSKIKFIPNKHSLKTIADARKKIAEMRKGIRANSLAKAEINAQKNIGKLSDRDLLMLGIGLYMGEGNKTANVLRIANSNPKIINLSIKWLIDSLKIEKSNLRLRLHLYPDCNEDLSIDFWSKMTKIPIRQFQKSYFDARIKKGTKKLLYGTCHVGVKGVGVFVVREVYALLNEVLDNINKRD